MGRLLLIIITATIIVLPSLSTAAGRTAKAPVKPKTAEVKTDASLLRQSELAKRIVDGLGFGEGLPENPVEKDYLRILDGKRTFRFEAEATYDHQSDQISIREYPLFGAFSGRGWVHATTTETAVHFKVFIPVSGRYTLKVTAKGDHQLWSVAGKAFRSDFGSRLTEKTLGQMFIQAGLVEFNALIPPDSAVDCFTFTAPAFFPVEPVAGWNLSAPLTADVLNEVFAAALGIEDNLEKDDLYPPKIIEASSLVPLPQTARLTDSQVRGRSVAANWVRAFQTGATIYIPIEAESTSVYRVRIRAVGTEIIAGFGGRVVTRPLPSSMDWVDLGTFRLPKGVNSLEINLPPTGGVDIVEVTKKLSGPVNYATITRTGISGNSPVQPAELEAALRSLQEQFKERK